MPVSYASSALTPFFGKLPRACGLTLGYKYFAATRLVRPRKRGNASMDPYPRKSACICGLFFFSLRSLCLLRLLSPGLDLCAFVTLCEPGHELYLSRNVVFCYLGRDFGVRFGQCSFSRTCSGRRVHSVSGENDVHRFIPIDRARCFDGARSLSSDPRRGETVRS